MIFIKNFVLKRVSAFLKALSARLPKEGVKDTTFKTLRTYESGEKSESENPVLLLDPALKKK
ncbi:hypothetical protein CH367_12480 [Leptospira barantonii]|uniref:Uncharacterized protein n=1 Tax=Leptospira barantonii TaxID=2023184 RepID=A0ABX4NPL4_9LEPT|nr:hypothetical protein CH367_12480 [Leptospira barantonii]